MDLRDALQIFNECKEHHKGCSGCPLNKILIQTHVTTYDICDCLIELEKTN